MAFATAGELAASMVCTFGPEEEAAVSSILEDATTMLSALVDVDPDDPVQAARLKMVCVNMASRKWNAVASGLLGVDQTSDQMGPFQRTHRMSNPWGDLFITPTEKAMLGIGGSYIGSIPAKIDGGC